MNTTQTLNKAYYDNGRPATGFAGRVRALWRNQEDAQQLLLEKQAPWLSRR